MTSKDGPCRIKRTVLTCNKKTTLGELPCNEPSVGVEPTTCGLRYRRSTN